MNNLDEVVEAVRAVAHLLPTRVFVTDPTGNYVWGSVRPVRGGRDHRGRDLPRRPTIEWLSPMARRDGCAAPPRRSPTTTARSIGYLSSLSDISDRVASETRFREIAEHTTDTVVRVDRTGKVTYISRAAELLGYTSEELAGISMAELVHPDDLALFADRDSLFDTDEMRQRRFRAVDARRRGDLGARAEPAGARS